MRRPEQPTVAATLFYKDMHEAHIQREEDCEGMSEGMVGREREEAVCTQRQYCKGLPERLSDVRP